MKTALSAAGVGMLAICVASCTLTPVRPTSTSTIFLPPAATSALTVIADPAVPGVPRQIENLLGAAGRPGLRLFVIDMSSGAVLDYATAPQAPRMRMPRPPMLPLNPTSFQRAGYRKAMASYRATSRRDWAELRARQRRELAAWAAAVAAHVAQARGAGYDQRGGAGLARALTEAATEISSLLQSGLEIGTRKVIAVLGTAAPSLADPPGLPSALWGATVAVADFPGTSADEADWQASLMQSGASRVVLLTPATGDQLSSVVREGLDGAVTVTLTRVLFASGGHKLLPAAIPTLRRLLWLLTVRYPEAAAVVDGYTDNRPFPAGNRVLSQERAEAVEYWLIDHGVAASRLQAFGYGSADPVAPNLPGGQPANRRVVVVIDPAG